MSGDERGAQFSDQPFHNNRSSHSFSSYIRTVQISDKMFKKESVRSSTSQKWSYTNNGFSLTAGAKSKVKSSAQRAIRQKVIETYPRLEPHIDDVMPKKEQLDVMKM